jgi:hypothetical protein
MTFSLAGTIDCAAAHLPPGLITADAWALVRQIADSLPASLTNWVDFECRLRGDAAQVDVSLRIDRRGRDQLAGHARVRSAQSPPAARPAWRRVASFTREWADACTSIHRDVDAMWLEFDVDPRADLAAARPRVFVDLAPHARTAPRRPGAIASALAPFVGRVAPAWVTGGVARCLAALPPDAGVLYVGLPAGERVATVRLCLRGLDHSRAAEYLGAAGWPGDIADFRRRLAAWHRPGPARFACGAILHVDLDARGGLGSRIGLEYPLRRRPQVKGGVAESGLLDDLVACGACAPAKRDAILAWPGCGMTVLPHELWPSLVLRRISHVKIVYDSGRPIEAKAYCCFAHAWRPRLASAYRPPALSAVPPIAP